MHTAHKRTDLVPFVLRLLLFKPGLAEISQLAFAGTVELARLRTHQQLPAVKRLNFHSCYLLSRFPNFSYQTVPSQVAFRSSIVVVIRRRQSLLERHILESQL